MTSHVDPFRQLRPVPERELVELSPERLTRAVVAPLAYDVYRDGRNLVIEFDVPGAAPEEVDVSVDGHTLEVRIRRVLGSTRDVDLVQAGRQHGEFWERLVLGDCWDLNDLTAEIRNGVLTVTAPFAAQRLVRRVDVTSVEASVAAGEPGREVVRYAEQEAGETTDETAVNGVDRRRAVHSAA